MDTLTHHPFHYKANPRKMEESAAQKNALGTRRGENLLLLLLLYYHKTGQKSSLVFFFARV
jgi:hypothetical protein